MPISTIITSSVLIPSLAQRKRTMFFLDLPIRLSAMLYSTIPQQWSAPRVSEWANNILGGKVVGSFLEGPCFDQGGNLYVVDIPFGRVFRISSEGNWSLVAEYDGWPNGLKCTPEGRIFVADHRLGLVEIKGNGKFSLYVVIKP